MVNEVYLSALEWKGKKQEGFLFGGELKNCQVYWFNWRESDQSRILDL